MQEGLPRELWCRDFAHLMRVGLPICVLAKEVVDIASHLTSGMVERRNGATLPAVATRHVRKDNGLFSTAILNVFIFAIAMSTLWLPLILVQLAEAEAAPARAKD
jgi:hypothetical protein